MLQHESHLLVTSRGPAHIESNIITDSALSMLCAFKMLNTAQVMLNVNGNRVNTDNYDNLCFYYLRSRQSKIQKVNRVGKIEI